MAVQTDDLVASRVNLAKEVGETGDQIDTYVAKIAELETALAAELATNPAAQAIVDEVTQGLKDASAALDAFQVKIAPPVDEEPPTDEEPPAEEPPANPSSRGSRGR